MANELSNLKPPVGAHKKRTRIGRGEGSGKGKTAGRGSKGQRARGTVPIWFEGGQMPLARRLAKRGFKNNFARQYTAIRIDQLANYFDDGAEVDAVAMLKAGAIAKIGRDGVKVIGVGGEYKLDKALKLRVAKCTAGARSAVTEAGGSVDEDDRSFTAGKKSKIIEG
jgi:large subunit ribosomal protein L15